MIKRLDECKDNFERSFTKGVGEHIPCEYLMSMVWTFDGIANNHNVYRGHDCLKKFCESFGENAINLINFENKKIIPLTNEHKVSNQKTKTCYICLKRSDKNPLMTKTIVNLKIIVIILVNTKLLHIAYVIWNIIYKKKLCRFSQGIKL